MFSGWSYYSGSLVSCNDGEQLWSWWNGNRNELSLILTILEDCCRLKIHLIRPAIDSSILSWVQLHRDRLSFSNSLNGTSLRHSRLTTSHLTWIILHRCLIFEIHGLQCWYIVNPYMEVVHISVCFTFHINYRITWNLKWTWEYMYVLPLLYKTS